MIYFSRVFPDLFHRVCVCDVCVPKLCNQCNQSTTSQPNDGGNVSCFFISFSCLVQIILVYGAYLWFQLFAFKCALLQSILGDTIIKIYSTTHYILYSTRPLIQSLLCFCFFNHTSIKSVSTL